MKINTKPNPFKALLAAAGLTLLTAISSQAVDRFWTAGTATWNNSANWGGNTPGGGDNAINNNGGTVVIATGDPTWSTFDIRGGDGGGTTGNYLQNGGTITMNSWFRMGINGGTGTYNMNGGTLSTRRFILADGGGSVGVFNQTNGVVTVVNDEIWLGQNNGSGTYNMSGGTLNFSSWFAIGRNGGSSVGVVNLTNGAINKTSDTGTRLIIGGNAAGTINQYGGTVSNTIAETWIAEGSGVGIWNLLGGTAILGTLNVAQGGTATLNLGGTGVLIANEIKPNGGSGLINFNGGTLQAGVSTTTLFHDIGTVLVNSNANLDTAGFNVTVAQILTDGGFGGGFVKRGAGTAKLTGVNTYTGQTTVNAGKLQVSTATSVSSSVVVSNSAGFGVIVAAANGQVSSASATLGSTAATTLDFDLSNFGNPTLAPLNVTGNLAVNGTVTVNIADAFPQVGQFPLIKYVTKTGAGSFVLGPLPVGVSATIVNNVGNSSIDLNITSTSLIRWDGRVAGGVWDINTTTNWTDYVTTAAAKFITGSAVFFDDLALGTSNVTLNVAVSPGSMIFTNDILPYTLSGNGGISGATSLVKQGTNSVTIGTTNSYTGATTISGGTLNITKLANGGTPSALGSASASAANLVLNGGTLSYSGPATSTDRGYSVTGSSNSTLNVQNDIIVNGAVVSSDGGTFTKTGVGLLTYQNQSANALASGNYIIQNGAVVINNSTNSTSAELQAGAGTNSTGGALIVSNSTLNISSWLAVARGTGTGGYTSSATINNSKLTSANMSMCYDAGVVGTLQTGYLTLNGNTTYTNGGDANVGESAGGSATVTLNDSSVFYSNGRLQVGETLGATGAVVVANSAKIVVNAWMSIGNQGGNGSVLVKDNGQLNVISDLNVCDVNTGTANLTLTNSAIAKANNLFVGKGAGSTATMTLWNNSQVVGQNNGGAYVELGSSAGAVGTINLNGGTLNARMIQSVNAGSGVLNFNGGLLRAAADAGQGVNANFLNNITTANVLAGGATIDSGTNVIRVGQALLDGGTGGGLTKNGTGTMFLNGASTYVGSTVVTAGTLGGNGSVNSAVTIQSTATLAPGDGLGTLTINSNLTLVGNLAIDVNKTNTPTTNDLVIVTGTLINTGTGTVKVSNLGTNNLVAGDKFTLFSQPLVGGAALTIPPSAGVIWSNTLAVDGSISVVGPILPPSFATNNPVSRANNGVVTINATGTVGGTYTLYGTTNLATPLASWPVISTGTITASPFSITDSSATSLAQRFYILATP